MFIAKINVWMLIFLCIGKVRSTETEAKEDLVQSESKDGTLEIIKQIKKVNNDGSYTVGYEADDGSFKIESRDVLGNIKGTYGYIDDTGKIKRVSYSSTNSTDIVHHVEGDSVVQRIPKHNRTFVSSTTNRPYHSTTTASSIQNLVKKKHNIVSSTTNRPTFDDSVSKSTTRTHLVYATTPRSRFLLKSSDDSQHTKQEGQLARPEELDRPTEIPLFRRLAANHPATEIKPVTEEPELKSNILRRQLPRENDYDPHQHIHNLQQSIGSDSPDVYSASMTTGTPRPLFTTTYRPIRLSSTTSPIRRATVRYPKNLQASAQHKEETTTSTEQEESNEQPAVSEPTPTTVPVVQIPANRAQPETLVALRHPYQRNTVLVPLSHIQRRLVPFASPRDINDNIQGYVPQLEQYTGEPTSNPVYSQEAPRHEYARRLSPLRPMPVQIDENGYVREYPQQSLQQKFVAVPIPVSQRYLQEVPSNSIENIQPPVSIRDFQIILQQLELRQKRLERLHELTDPRRISEYQQKRNFEPNQYYRRFAPNTNQVVQFVPNQDAQGRRHYDTLRNRELPYQDSQNQYEDEQFAQSYVPTKRVARLLKNTGEPSDDEEYLPADIREMLLLKMLQLAVNPALPPDSEESGSTNSPVNYFKKDPSRNVEILGEEQEQSRRPSRVKRFKEADDLEYTE
ncbi:uncharacterized protein LOC123676278 [Harmonia axyridis]|uniref:uncharacterized protein LOC123676278 n=1 Tax=Harmonia axyridis TaxID=115357 RepID=UPI001E27704E|nr:uncharacterized protein LOC123676278 [Harmonia axyridis]